MKKVMVVISLLVMATVTWAQNEVKKDPIVFDSLTYDYGTIAKGSPGECTFNFKNVTKQPIILTNVKASCGCTTPSYTKEEIKPKKKGQIQVKYNTNNIGYFTKTISVYTNQNPDSPIILTIKGQVVEQ